MPHPISFSLIVIIIIMVLPISNAASNKNIGDMQLEVPGKLDLDNPYIADTAMTIAKDYPGEYSINQVCAIYDAMAGGGWYYYSEANDADYFQNANLTLQRGKISDTIGSGDCDDFAILMASLIESLGGSTRITFAWDAQNKNGHAYAEVYLGRKGDPNVNDLVDWMKSEYDLEEITGLNRTGNEVWLNLDWGTDHPGDGYFGNNSKSIMKAFIRESSSRVSPRIVPVIDSMDSAAGWELIRDEKGSSINTNTTSLKKGLVLQVHHDLKKDGWAGISKEIDPKAFSGIIGINFSCYLMGNPNSVELRLRYEDGTAFGFSWSSLDREKWLSLKALFSDFSCLYPEENYQAYRNKLDITKVKRMEFVVFNNPDEGDKPGSGTVLIDHVQGAMAIPVGSPWARTEEQRQKTIALQLASNAQYIRNQTLDLLPLSVLLAAESLSRYPCLEADTILRQGLSLLPNPVADKYQEDWIYDIELSPDGTRLAMASLNETKSTLRVLEASTLKGIVNITHKGYLRAIAFSRDGTLLALADYNNAEVWEVDSGREILNITYDSLVNGVAFSWNGTLLATTSSDGVVRVWEINMSREIANVALNNPLSSIAFSPEGKIRVLCVDQTHFPESTLKVIEVESGKELLNVTEDLSNVVLSPDGSRLSSIALMEDYTIKTWNIDTGSKLNDIIPGYDVSATAINQDGTRLAVGGRYGTVRVWNVDTSQEVSRVIQNYRIWAVALNSDGTRLATSSGGGTTIVSKVDTSEEISRMTHPNWVYTLILSPDGAQIAKACADDKTVRIMKVRGGGEVINSGSVNFVNGFAFSPDSTRLAIISNDGTVRIWSAYHGHESALIPYQNGVGLIFSRDGSKIATIDRNNTVSLWDTDTSKGLANITHEDWVTAIDFSPDGTQLVTGTREGKTRLWDINTGKELINRMHNGSVTTIDFSPNGKEIATGSLDGVVKVWNIITGEEVAGLTHEDVLVAVAFDPKGDRLATVSLNETSNTMKVWEVYTGKEIASSTEKAKLEDLALSIDKTRLARVYDFNATVWNTSNGEEVSKVTYVDRILDAALSPEGSQLTTASWGNNIAMWDIGPEFTEITGEGKVWGISFSPKGVPLVTVSKKNTLRVLAIDSGKEISNITLEGSLYDAAISSNGTTMVAILNLYPSDDRILSIWRTDTGKEIASTICKDEIGLIRAISPNGKRIVTVNDNHILRIWDTNTAREIVNVTLTKKSTDMNLNEIMDSWRGITDIVFSPNGSRLAVAIYDGTARILEVETGQEIARVKHDYGRPVEAIAFSPDGSRLATAAGDLTARIWDTNTGKGISSMTHEGELSDIEFSPDGKLIATACNDLTARVWEAETGREIAKMSHKNGVDKVLFDPEGRKLITISGDSVLRIWDWEEGKGREIANIVHESDVNYAVFIPDGTKLITTSGDDTVSTWNWRTEDMIAEACSRLTQNLKQEEWRSYSGSDEPYRKICHNLKQNI